MKSHLSRYARLGLGATLVSLSVAGITSSANAQPVHPTVFALTAVPVLRGSTLSHTFTPVGSESSVTEPLSKIDDLSQFGGALVAVFQNGVGPNGEASTSGNLDSTVVEFTPSGQVLGQWDVAGRTDGVVADAAGQRIIATVNEDGNSSLYVITPGAPALSQVTHYTYDTGLTHGGGTDSPVLYRGQLLISASNPGTANGPAVYVASLNASTKVASLTPLMRDNDAATVANVGATWGATTTLALSDPDSSIAVPDSAPRFGGSFELTSQGDQQQIYVRHAGTPRQSLAVLNLSQSVDDTAWATSRHGTLYASDSAANSVDALSGRFSDESAYAVATPCSANSAPSVCTAPNYLATVNPWTGQVSAVSVVGAPFTPKGALVFVAAGEAHGGHEFHFGGDHR